VKILFLMDSPEYLRFYDTVVEEMLARGHRVAIGVNNQRARKPVGLEGLQAYADRISLLGVVPERRGIWAGVARSVRATMDFVRFLHPRLAAAPALRARIKRKILPRALHWLDRIPSVSPRTVRRIERVLAAAEQAIPLSRSAVNFLREQAPDVLLVSPLVTAASTQVDWVRAARACGIRTAVCIASWDNLTNKGLLRVEPDRVLVWNELQRREAEEYHYVPAAKVVVTGAQLFDRWFARSVTRPREVFARHVGLADGEPFVLFTGSSSFISESSAEVAFVRRWVQALRTSSDPVLREIRVLVRPHPYNVHRWADDPTADLPGVTIFPRQSYNPVDEANRSDFFDSLYHCAAVVGINTSAMIEAAIVGRPVSTLMAEEFSSTQEGTLHFHYLRPEQGGFLRIATTLDEHVAQLGACLRDPALTRAETARFVASFIRPHGVDRPATPMFADAVIAFGDEPAPRPAPPPVWTVAVRPVLLALALPVLAIERVSDPDWARRWRKRIARVRDRWRRSFRQAW